MKIYKFQDTVDGDYAFVAAQNEVDAVAIMQNLTCVPLILVEIRTLEEIGTPFVLINRILPF